MKHFFMLFLALFVATLVFAQAPKSAITEDVISLSDSNTEFAVSLYEKLAEQEQGNFFFSPLSITTALGMVYLGAAGSTEKEMAQTLEFKLDKARLAPAFNSLLNKLNVEPHVKLSVVNSLWAEKTYPIQKNYMDWVVQSYGAELRAVDFLHASEPTRQEINSWVSDKTNRRIENLIPERVLSPETVLTLVNAIYFKAGWADKFKVRHTQDGVFSVDAKTEVNVPLMYHNGDFRYGSNKNVQVIELPYQGETTSMIIILPKEKGGLAEAELLLMSKALKSVVEDRLRMQEVELFLPKFKITSQFELNKVLPLLGMKEAFVSGKANFSGIDGTRKLFVSNVIHKTFIQVDEEGTEAAGATAVVGKFESFSEPVVFRADHPFVFFIVHKPTGVILFMGRIVNPS